MLGFSYGEVFLLLGATADLIGPKDLPIISRTAGRLAGRAVGYVQLARGQIELRCWMKLWIMLHICTFFMDFTFDFVLSMSRLGGAGAVAPLVTDIPLSSVEEEGSESGRNQPAWEKWSNDGTEKQVAKLMEENVGAAMQFLQSKASAIYQSQPSDNSSIVKPETTPPP
ncbi:transcription factor UNE12-like [Trifolium pratense]|uniref:transcription factor UNE12-like n=1 Tax=Trifolium pratense TaxID=57577 RepID=UPI001E690F02|nr:transcription factor UNE12-like [Trifolium pratense]XP_045808499.1 transcription factor UNE12-like [Trifolium pratense]XP_045808503.1 transcription factor UNE12-like [Trifolium pratense]